MLLVLLLFALAVRGRAAESMYEGFQRDPDGYRAIAHRLYHHGEFSRAWHGGTQPTAYRSPLYPVSLSICYRLRVPFVLFHVLLGAGTIWGVWRLGPLCGLPLWATALAAVLVTVDPILVHQSAQLMSETLAAFLAVWTLVGLSLLAREASLKHAVLAGALMGLCILCRPTFLAWFACVALAIPFLLEVSRRRVAVLWLLFIAAAAAVVAPWPIRNYRLFGTPIVTTTHGGYTLLLANNPGFYEYLASAPWGSVWDATEFHQQWDAIERALVDRRAKVASLDERRVDQEAYQLAWEQIRREPRMFAYACLMRLGRLWGIMPHQVSPDESPSRRGTRYAVAVWYAAELTLAIVGLWTLRGRLLKSPWVWGMLLALSLTAVHAVYWTDLRMRAPAVGVVALAAAAGMARLAAGRRAAKPLAVLA
jgi:hypothetical protein